MVEGGFQERKDAIGLRSMGPEDIPLGMRLKTLAGWNQTSEDWALLLQVGYGLVAEVDGVGVGTATVVPHADAFAWIGMVLVDPPHRRRGIGTALLEAAVGRARQHGVARLDATPQGKPIYARLGFAEDYDLLRLRRWAGAAESTQRSDFRMDGGAYGPEAVSVQQLSSGDLGAIDAYDAPVFGASRSFILGALWERAPHLAYQARRGGRLVGYCLGRPGSEHVQIGPVVAEDAAAAQALLAAALNASGPVSVIADVPADHSAWIGYLTQMGFGTQRSFTRMSLSSGKPCRQPAGQFAIGGPEIG